MSGDIKFSVLCTLFLEEFDLIVLFSSRGRWQLWQNLEAKGDPLIFHHLILLTADCHFDTQVDFSLVQENIILEERMSFFVQWLEIIGNEWSRFLKNRFYIQENSKTLLILCEFKQCTFSLFS